MKLVTLTMVVLCGSLSAGCREPNVAKNAAKKEPSTLRNVRICDTSGCYVAWKVFDSDGDGVSDADELMAGTNPHDPRSRPTLSIVAELGGQALLPSFEAGVGVFFIFPAELHAMVKKSLTDPLASFPLARERADPLVTAFPVQIKQEDSLLRLGISTAQLTQRGIDLKRDGLTVGFGKNAVSGVPERRLGGIEVRLISADADDDLTPLPDLPHKDTELADGTVFTEYRDGTKRWDRPDGSSLVVDKNGDEIGALYVNPDAEQGSTVTAPTPEQKVAFERLRGSSIRTVEGWSTPVADGTTPTRDKRETIILVDPEYAYNPATVFVAPNVTTAQPESRPDLPRPDVPADPSGPKDCTVGCP